MAEHEVIAIGTELVVLKKWNVPIFENHQLSANIFASTRSTFGSNLL